MSTKTDNPVVREAWRCVLEAHNATSLAHSCFADLGTLFQAIADASGEHSQAAKLAKIGGYLADDWANCHDSARENLERHLDTLRRLPGFQANKSEEGDA